MALKLSLKPGERVIVNGAVITNGDRRSSFIIQNRASILREKDIMQEDEVNTPAERIYFPVMLLYMDEDGREAYYEEFVRRMTEFMNVIESPEAIDMCAAIGRHAIAGNYYKALTQCRKLIKWERERLGDVSESLPANTASG